MQHINTERTKIQTMVAIEGSVNLKHLHKPPDLSMLSVFTLKFVIELQSNIITYHMLSGLIN